MNPIIIIILEKIREAIGAILNLHPEEAVDTPPAPMDMPREPEATQLADGAGAMNMSIPPAPGDSALEPDEPPDVTHKKFIPPTEAIELDSEGIPWDARIHSGSKKKLVKKNIWKLLRGVDAVTVAKIKTELAQGVLGEAPPPIEPKQEVLEPTTMTWTELLVKISTASLDNDIANAACQKYGVADIGTLQDTPALVPLVAKDLGLT